MKPQIKIFHIQENFAFDDFKHKIWCQAENVSLMKYWSGALAPLERRATARLLWTNSALMARFDCQQHEPFVINQNPQTDVEAEKLWERDVCEIFVAPDKNKSEKYFEFEVAPTGEWLDYAVTQLSDCREIDTNYDSGVKTTTQIFENSFSLIFRIEWEAFGKKPKIGDEWLGNLFRCIGTGTTRGYLAWQPTLTLEPNFHVPQAFGTLKFL
ncbi:MAG: carbohydrate-binding family 9-like protein [Pyrinomonadaceae bacterium]